MRDLQDLEDWLARIANYAYAPLAEQQRRFSNLRWPYSVTASFQHWAARFTRVIGPLSSDTIQSNSLSRRLISGGLTSGCT